MMRENNSNTDIELVAKDQETIIKEDENFCRYCGKLIKKAAVICPMCGIQLKELKTAAPTVNLSQNVTTQVFVSQPYRAVEPKSKIAAIVLAIFFGFWSYLYTYSYDSAKFWLIIIMNIIAIPITLYFILKGSSSAFIFLWIFIGVFSYTWPILNHLLRPASVYKNYPNY